MNSNHTHKMRFWYLLGVLFKISGDNPRHFYMGAPPDLCPIPKGFCLGQFLRRLVFYITVFFCALFKKIKSKSEKLIRKWSILAVRIAEFRPLREPIRMLVFHHVPVCHIQTLKRLIYFFVKIATDLLIVIALIVTIFLPVVLWLMIFVLKSE